VPGTRGFGASGNQELATGRKRESRGKIEAAMVGEREKKAEIVGHGGWELDAFLTSFSPATSR
jgi:hypothetical protein